MSPNRPAASSVLLTPAGAAFSINPAHSVDVGAQPVGICHLARSSSRRITVRVSPTPDFRTAAPVSECRPVHFALLSILSLHRRPKWHMHLVEVRWPRGRQRATKIDHTCPWPQRLDRHSWLRIEQPVCCSLILEPKWQGLVFRASMTNALEFACSRTLSLAFVNTNEARDRHRIHESQKIQASRFNCTRNPFA